MTFRMDPRAKLYLLLLANLMLLNAYNLLLHHKGHKILHPVYKR